MHVSNTAGDHAQTTFIGKLQSLLLFAVELMVFLIRFPKDRP